MVNFDPSKDKDARKRIDTVWEKLMVGGKALMPLDTYPFSERYGWVQDKYGVVWQISPDEMNTMFEKGTREQIDRITQAFLPMKKLDIAKIKKAYKGK